MITAYKVVTRFNNRYFGSTASLKNMTAKVDKKKSDPSCVEYKLGKWTKPRKDAGCQFLFVFETLDDAWFYVNASWHISYEQLVIFKCEVDSITANKPESAFTQLKCCRFAKKVKLIEKID